MKNYYCVPTITATQIPPSCATYGSKPIFNDLSQHFQHNHLAKKIEESPCLVFCQIGPNAHFVQKGEFFDGIL